MAENLASRDGRPVLDLAAGREAQAAEFSFSREEGGGGRCRGAGRGGLGGRAGGAEGGAEGFASDGGGGARRFLLLRGVEPAWQPGLEQGVEVLLWDRTLFSTTTERDPSKRDDQLGTSFLSS